ncbi:MAG TPA: RNase adapter RapZ, partial [Actinomycetota bacterium]|nr:RNase adapter RapZ [Actinomycetota bacterium]
LGYFVIDNLPPALMSKMVELVASSAEGPRYVAFVVDVRSGSYFEQLSEALRELGRNGIEYRILFLTASDDVLIRRFESTKRKHPLADRVIDGITKERALLESLREAADLVIDTSRLSVHDLRDRVVTNFSSQAREDRLKTTVLSFGFKHGLPVDADMVLDCRFLPNPHWVDELRPLVGTNPIIQEYVLEKPATKDFLERIDNLLDGLVPGFLDEGKRYLTIAIGCTGGRHRSVVLAQEIAELLRKRGLPVSVRHRDMERE